MSDADQFENAPVPDDGLRDDCRRMVVGFFREQGMITLVLIVMIFAMSRASPAFLEWNNLLIVVRQVAPIAIVAIGVTMVIITAGIDLASGSVIALVSVIVASLAHPNQFPVIVPVAVGLATGALTGAISGTVVAVGRIPAFIATLGMMMVARGLALVYSHGRPISGFSESFDFIGRGKTLGIPFPIWVLAASAIVIHILLVHTRFGKHVYAIGGNPQAAVVSGIHVNRRLIQVYTLAGMLSGLAGIVLTSRISSGQPAAGVAYELDAIAAAVIGGTSLSGGVGTVYGTVVGALIIGVLNTGLVMFRVDPHWEPVIKGALIVGAVLLDKLRHR
jgi:inositol transport system permease protein